MAISDGLGIQALVQSYDKKAVSQAFAEIAKDFNKSADELNNEINKIKIDKDVMNNLVNQIKALPEEVRKKTQGMSFDLFSDLINADGVEEKIDEAFKLFSNKIQSFVKLRDQIGNDKIIIETDLEDLNKLTDKMREVINLQEQIKGTKGSNRKTLKSNLESTQNEINTWVQARNQVDKYNVELDEVKKNITELAKANRNVDWSNIDNKNIDTIKEMVGWLERYAQLTGDISGIKELNIPGVIDLNKLFKGNITSIDPNLTQQVKDFQDIIKRYSGNFNIPGSTQVFDDTNIQKLKEQEQEINNIKKALSEKESQLEQVNQKYIEQSNLVSKLGNDLEVLKESKNPKIIETDEYKNIISELETAKNKTSEFQKEMDNLRQTVEVLKGSLSSYDTGDVVPRQDFENANRVINNLTSIIKELETSLTETEGKFASLSSEVTKLQQDKSALDEQLAQQKEINAGQQEQISNSQKIKIELDEIKKKYQDLKNSIKEMEDAQSRYMALLDKFDQAEAFNEAIQNVHYNEGKNTPEEFVNFDYLDKAKQKLQETGNAYEKATKAAVYYYQYLQKGGTEKIFNQDGKDISDELISLYKEMSSLANDKTGLISYESINKTVREYANELRLAKEELSSEKELISQKNKELKETLSLEKNIAKTKQEAQNTEKQTKDTTAKSSGKRTMSREVAFSIARQKKQQVNQGESSNISQPLQQDSSSILSEQQVLEKLEQAIKSVTVAIAEKNKAIQAEEVQMDLSINQEIKKLEELKGKLNEIKTEFENGIASGLFKSKTNTDGGNNGSDGNTQSIELVPLIDDNQWMNAVDDIITKIGTKKINIEPDMTSEEWNTLKNYIDNISKQVINMKFINGDSALPSDLSTSYTNSTKYVTELYKIEEKIARAKENNNKRELENLTTLEAEKKKFEDLLKLEEQFRANDRFKDFDTTVKDNNLNKLISTKEQEYQANRVAAETSLTNKLPSIEEEAYKVNESFNNTKSLEKVNSLLDEQKKKWQEIQDIRIQMETLDLNDSANKDQNKIEYENLDAQKKYLEEEKKLIDDELKQYDSLIDKATELKQIRELDKITSDADSQINGDRISNISNAYNEAVRINNALNNTETTLENLKNTIRDVRNQTSNEIFGNALKNAEQDAEELKNQLISGQISLSQYNSAIRNIQKDVFAQKDAVGFIDVDNIDQAREALTNYAREVTNGTIENVQWNASTSTLTGSFVNENKEVQKVTASIKQLSTGSQVATVSFGKAEKQVTSFSKFIDELGAKFRNLSTYLLSFVGFYEVWGAIQQGVTYVRELDTALTEMRKVSDETVESLREFQEESFDIADSVGATAKTIQNSTADWMRLGESIEEAAKSAEVSNILLNVSEFTDINDATDALVSMSQAYNEFEKIDIVDKLNNIGNLYSISTDGIATALQDSASALTTAGNTLDEAIALVTAGNAIVQDPNSVGSGKLMPEHIVICGYLFYKC